jgi:hypothetical protein
MNTQLWSPPESAVYWLRAQPKAKAKSQTATGPRLTSPGAALFKTQPDGLWVTLGISKGDLSSAAEFIDCVVVEVCGNMQNVNDKRSRFAARTSSLMVELKESWLAEKVATPGYKGPLRSRSELLGGGLTDDTHLPVRHLRVLYTLPKAVYPDAVRSLLLEGHEYIAPHSKLGQYHGPPMQSFLRRMAPHQHYMSS